MTTLRKRQPKDDDAGADIADDGTVDRSSVGSGGIPYQEWSDIDLVGSLVDECGDAYAELYRRHRRSVSAATRMVLVNDDRCEDVVAEVFVDLWFFPEKFDPARGSLLAFLRMRARGRGIDMVRSEAARHRREQTDQRADVTYAKDPDTVILATESAAAVREALASLPVTESEPIYLAFFSGMTYRAVAAQLDLPEGTVKSRIRAGLNRLQTCQGLRLERTIDANSEASGDAHTSSNAKRPVR